MSDIVAIIFVAEANASNYRAISREMLQVVVQLFFFPSPPPPTDRFAFLYGMNHWREPVDPDENGRVAGLSRKCANLGRSSARAIGSEKHVLKHASPFTNETDCLILSDKEKEKARKKRIWFIRIGLLSKVPDKKITHLMNLMSQFLRLIVSYIQSTFILDFYILQK